jgi:hypothetical protein
MHYFFQFDFHRLLDISGNRTKDLTPAPSMCLRLSHVWGCMYVCHELHKRTNKSDLIASKGTDYVNNPHIHARMHAFIHAWPCTYNQKGSFRDLLESNKDVMSALDTCLRASMYVCNIINNHKNGSDGAYHFFHTYVYAHRQTFITPDVARLFFLDTRCFMSRVRICMHMHMV